MESKKYKENDIIIKQVNQPWLIDAYVIIHLRKTKLFRVTKLTLVPLSTS